MLDPTLLEELARLPERNSPEVNEALAEQGSGSVLRHLVGSSAAHGAALAIAARRIAREGTALFADEDDPHDAVRQLERGLVHHENAPDAVRDALAARHADDAFFVLCASSHPRATLDAIERAARWPARLPVLDRSWLALITPRALPPLVADAWSQSPDTLLREAAARIARDRAVLERLANDERREVRRAVASNPAAGELRGVIETRDAAVEVRARAAGALGEHTTVRVLVDSARFAAALRALEDGGVLAPDVANALANAGASLDEEGAMMAARALGRERVVGLIAACATALPCHAGTGLALGLGLRHPFDERLGGEAEFRELMSEAAKALSRAGEQFGALTGKARLAAFVSDALVASPRLDAGMLTAGLATAPLASETVVLARSAKKRSELVVELCAASVSSSAVPPSLLELAWKCTRVDDDAVLAIAKKLGAHRKRGRELSEDELDLAPAARSLELLEEVVLCASRAVTVSPRAALGVIALDSRRVRYVLTAMPAWRGQLSGTMLGRVLRHYKGALTAGPAEQRSRGSEAKGWTERMLNDIELAVALAIGHLPVDALVDRLESERHRLDDGVGLAMAAEARAAVAGRDATQPLFRWAAKRRDRSGAALALWLLLEEHDSKRTPGMVASAIDSLASQRVAVEGTVTDALATLERRNPGVLESFTPQTPRGRATHASAIARAYRAVGGLRDEH